MAYRMILLTFSAAYLYGQTAQKPVVEFEMMTWAEVKKAIHEEGKTTALVYNGGTEQRGPQNVNGGHTLMARATVRATSEIIRIVRSGWRSWQSALCNCCTTSLPSSRPPPW